ncbi:MAG: FISUMP domain-containing protein [Candidatus Saccharibacteria bacterium]|nr:FISUMP domain-containing protein [Candidatus Saccharibacteria bacterium]
MINKYWTKEQRARWLVGSCGDWCLAVALVGVMVVSGASLTESRVWADDSVIDDVGVEVPVSCTMAGTGMTSHTANIPNGIYEDDIGSTTLKAFCNDNGGFAIYATGYTGNTIGGENSNKLVGTPSGVGNIATGTATGGNVSNWAMKLETSSGATYPIELDNGFGAYSAVPNAYTKVAHRNSGTDLGSSATGATLTSTYAAYIAHEQAAGTYSGQVIYTMVHPASEEPLQPQPSTAGYINYYANASTAVGSMGRQSASDGATVELFASNFSRDGYGFAGWSDAYDYATNPNAHFYGPNEDITVPTGTTAGGLSLYAVWVKSAGSMQQNAASVCSSLTPATYNNEGDTDESTWSITASLNSITALTDDRDGDTYAIARLSDGKCWMIENLRLADSHQEGASSVPTTLTTTNTNNPLNDGNATDPTVALKHNYTDTDTFTNLSATSSVAYDESTAPDGWCTTSSAACDDQSRLRTDNTANRVSYSTTQSMSTGANLYSYGNYYNWYSATAGRGTYSTGSNVTTTGDLCPYGWHLPTGTGSGEFGLLSNSLGGYKNASDVAQQMTSSTSPTVTIMLQRLRHFPNNFVYSGNVNGASLSNRGSGGYYWSSTAYSNNVAYYLYFYSSSVYPGTNGSSRKYLGRTVRCVVVPGA